MDRDPAVEGSAHQERSCREVGDSMVAAVEQGSPARALSMFEPGLLIQVGCSSPRLPEKIQSGSPAACLPFKACAAKLILPSHILVRVGWVGRGKPHGFL
jgi:hypothetical protein